jgi:hypothetical protein
MLVPKLSLFVSLSVIVVAGVCNVRVASAGVTTLSNGLRIGGIG